MSTRAEELAPVPWSAEQKQAFLARQFEAQDKDYRANYEDGDFLVIQVEGRDAGRLYVHRSEGELHIIDIALLPEARGRGIGTRILNDLLAEAEASGRTTRIYVENFNPARRLYERLGFQTVEEKGLHLLMVKEPSIS